MSDPLDALRMTVVPIAPDPVFAANLRRRLQLEMTGDQEQEETMTEALLRDQMSRNGTRHGDVSYITLALPDAAAGRTFYGSVLGWTFAAGQLEEEGNQVDEVIPQVGLWPAPAWRAGMHAGAILCFRVDDIGAAVETVRDRGGTATEIVQQPYGRESECTDGQGLRFFLHQLPPPGAPVDPNGSRQGDISYVVLKVADLGRAQRFFSSLLGWSFEPGRSGVHVQGPAPMTGMSEGDAGAILCFQVDDLTSAVDRVRQAGGTAQEITQQPYGLESTCVDNQGVPFFLHQF